MSTKNSTAPTSEDGRPDDEITLHSDGREYDPADDDLTRDVEHAFAYRDEMQPEEPPHTPGPWGWMVHRPTNTVSLRSYAPGLMTQIVMEMRRWGCHGAAPWFTRNGLLDGLLSFTAPFKGREHHADWALDIEHPDARLMAAAPGMYDACVKAEATFRRYAELHRAKGTPEGKAKALENERLADEMRAALPKAEVAV